MDKWADYLISEVNYDSEHLISIAIRHQDTSNGITKGLPVDRLTISSDIKNGLSYVTIYAGNNTWKKGNPIQTFSIEGTPYLRIDGNKVNLDFLGDLPNASIKEEKQIQELELQPEPEELPSSSRGSLPKESAEELPQELELQPEPEESQEATPEQVSEVDDLEHQIDELDSILSTQISLDSKIEEEATPEQVSEVDDLEHQIDELENTLFTQLEPSLDITSEQISRVNKLEQEIEKLGTIELEQKIISTLQKQNKKLDDIEKKLQNATTKTKSIDSLQAYCVKCKTKREIKTPEAVLMKNGRDAVKGFCSVCNCKVFRIGKMK